MSKPDSANGSLDSILASIRKSLSEQSTDALHEAPPVPADQTKKPKVEAKPEARARTAGLSQRLAGADAADVVGQAQGNDDLSDLLEEPPPGAAGTAVPGLTTQPAAAESGAIKEDPLWFLTRTEGSAAADGPPSPAAAPASEKKPAAEPTLTRPEVIRASMPPFFGSTAEVAKPEPLAEPNSSTGAAALPPRPLAPPPPPQVTANSTQPVASPPPATAVIADVRPASLRNGQVTSPPIAPTPTTTEATGDVSAVRGLEAAVLDLLKPMLSQWLDQNMPRLVAEALKDEGVRGRGTGGDAKKA